MTSAAAAAINSGGTHKGKTGGSNDDDGSGIVATGNTGFTAGALAATVVNGKLRIPSNTSNDYGTYPTFAISNIEFSRGTHSPVGGSDITSRISASTALGVIDTAINDVNSTRASLGAPMSRLEYASDNLQDVVQNTGAARNRILDTDRAAETSGLARTQIIQQADTAMLAQANQSQQAVLALLN